MSLEEGMEGEEARAGGEVSWRLLATLEITSLLLVLLALALHALRSLPARARSLAADTVLVTKGETELGQKIAEEFLKAGCRVTLLSAPPKVEFDRFPEVAPTVESHSEANTTTKSTSSINKPVLAKNKQLPNILFDNDGIKVAETGTSGPKVERTYSEFVRTESKDSSNNTNTVTSINGETLQRIAPRIIYCNTRSRDELLNAAENIGSLDILVVCGAESNNNGLDALANSVSEEIYSNLQVVQEIGNRLRKGGSAVWVCREPRGNYSAAVSAVHAMASTVLRQVALKSGSRAVWCEGRDETTEQLAARVVRTVACHGALPNSADVFREVKYRVRSGLYEIYNRFCKLWT